MPIISNNRTELIPSGLSIASGRMDNVTLRGRGGLNLTVGTSHETICAQGGIRSELSATETLKVTSTSTSDTNSGSGAARKVRITGLDADGNKLDENVNMNGTGVVDTVGTFQAVNRVQVIQVGSGGEVNAGDIKVFANDGTTELLRLATGENHSQSAHYDSPASTNTYITSFVYGTGGSDPAEISVWVKRPGEGENWVKKLSVICTASTNTYKLYNPIMLDPLGHIEFRAKSLGSGNISASVDFQLIEEV